MGRFDGIDSAGRVRRWGPVLFTLFCQNVHAVVPMYFERLGSGEGLSQQAAHAIAQDSLGFLWVGTEAGLNRFDGFTFATGSPNSFILDLAADASGRLWIATDGDGVLVRDPGSGKFETLSASEALEGLSSARTVALDDHERLWVGTREAGLAVYDLKQRTWTRFRHQKSDAATLSSDAVHRILLDANGAWVATAGGLDYVDDSLQRAVKRHRLGTPPWQSLGAVAVRALAKDQNGNLWVGTDRGLVRLRPHTGEQTIFRAHQGRADGLPSDEVAALLVDSAGRLWVGTTAGLALFDAQRESFTTYKHDATDSGSLPDDRILSLFEDRGGILWVGTQLGAVAKWNPRSWGFGHRLERSGPADVNSIASFAVDASGTQWVGTFGAGLRQIDSAGQEVRRWRRGPASANGLSDDRVMALLADREGAIWVGTMGGGLNRIAPDKRSVLVLRHEPGNPHSLPSDGVMSLLEDADGQLWVGTYQGGLSRLDPNTRRFRPAIQAGAGAPLVDGRITALSRDRLGRLWAGTDGAGLCVLDPARSDAHCWRRGAIGLTADTIYALHVDARGDLWVATHGGGVLRLAQPGRELSKIEFIRYDQNKGLPDNTVYGVLSDALGWIWLSSTRGLAALDPVGGQVRSFHRSHGLQGEEFNFGAALRAPDGRLYFGGNNGYNVFDPARLQSNAIAPPVVLTAVSKLNQPLRSPTPYERLADLHLGFRDQVVSFEFAALDFAAPRENRYQYRLEGFDRDWVDAGARRSATYTRLAGGDYVFRVRASNADGVWNEAGTALALKVDAPPWLRPWAFIAYACVFCLLVWAAWVAHRRKLEREEQYSHRLEQQVSDRTRELAERNSALESANRQLEEASLTDPLTGLANRRALMEALPRMAAVYGPERRSAAHAGQMVLMVVDLDYFKPINDIHGHDAGDAVLKQVAAILRESVRAGDLAVRWGGDEFVAVYAAADIEEGAALAERLRQRIAKHRFKLANGQIARTSCSIGFVCYPFVAQAPQLLNHEQALNVADAALLQAKLDRNAWVGWSGTPQAQDITGLFRMLDADPKGLMARGGLKVCASPHHPEDTVENLIRSARGR